MQSHEPSGVLDGYAAALREYLAAGEEAPLLRAYEIGRQALASQTHLLALIDLHREALSRVIPAVQNGRDAAALADAANRFLAEFLSPWDMLRLRNRDVTEGLRQMNRLLEEEAKRVAHALHDQAAPLLATVYLDVADIARSAQAPRAEQLKGITSHLDQLREQLRRLSHEVHPPLLEELGLVRALQFLAKGIQERTGLKVSVHGRASRHLPELAKTTVYRVAQEALNNVTRHSGATRVRIELSASKARLECTVRDNGRGFDPAARRAGAQARGLGLIGMEERVRALGGDFRIDSSPGKGTTVHISIPRHADERP